MKTLNIKIFPIYNLVLKVKYIVKEVVEVFYLAVM